VRASARHYGSASFLFDNLAMLSRKSPWGSAKGPIHPSKLPLHTSLPILGFILDFEHGDSWAMHPSFPGLRPLTARRKLASRLTCLHRRPLNQADAATSCRTRRWLAWYASRRSGRGSQRQAVCMKEPAERSAAYISFCTQTPNEDRCAPSYGCCSGSQTDDCFKPDDVR
jgi:hypothetical protein